jgi:hypothetical protein
MATEQETHDEPEARPFASSPSLTKLFTALGKAQSELSPAKADSTNPHFRSRYADLTSVWDAIRGPFATHGLAVIQLPGSADGGTITCTTVLGHTSGEWVSSTLTLALSKTDPQAVGSALTYARRYLLTAIAGVSPEDDDGNAASQPHSDDVAARTDPGWSKPLLEQAQQPSAGTGRLISDKQSKRLFAITKAAGRDPADVAAYLKETFGYGSSREIERDNYDQICDYVAADKDDEEAVI